MSHAEEETVIYHDHHGHHRKPFYNKPPDKTWKEQLRSSGSWKEVDILIKAKQQIINLESKEKQLKIKIMDQESKEKLLKEKIKILNCVLIVAAAFAAIITIMLLECKSNG